MFNKLNLLFTETFTTRAIVYIVRKLLHKMNYATPAKYAIKTSAINAPVYLNYCII